MPSVEALQMPEAEIMLYRDFFPAVVHDQFYRDVLAHTAWQQRHTRFGRPVPRLTAFHGDVGKSYAYSGIVETPRPWTPTLLLIKHRIEAIADTPFNTVLLNLYRHQHDSVAWHSDDEEELGIKPVIASVSLGAERLFRLRHKAREQPTAELFLPPGSLLLMRGETQQNWQHCVPKMKQPHRPRLNLTYRLIK